jgi:hypothetical protein
VDAVAIIGPTIEEACKAKHNLKAMSEAGLSPFTRRPLLAPHILASKGMTVKHNAIDYSKLDYTQPVNDQVQRLLGKGVRLTSGNYATVRLSLRQI